MTHKLTMHKLEALKRDKLEEVKQLQKEISKIDSSMKEHRRLYLLENKHAEECNAILDGYNRDNIREILAFLLSALAEHDSEYIRIYKNIDMNKLIQDESFFDFLITQIGRATIVEMKKRFTKVGIVDGEEMLEAEKIRLNRHNFNNRMFKKFSKKSVLKEAEKITKNT